MKLTYMRSLRTKFLFILILIIFFSGFYFDQWWWIIGFIIGIAVLAEGWMRYSTMD